MGEQLGAIAKPDDIRFADNLPKTRSGKIMRRLLKAIARGEEITQDVSTLENPAILEQLRGVDGRSGRGAHAAAQEGRARQAAKRAAQPTQRRKARPAASKRAGQGARQAARGAPPSARAARR